MKSIMNGYLMISAISSPIQVYSATESAKSVLHMSHRECNFQIKQHWNCPHCERDVTWNECGRGIDSGNEDAPLIPVSQAELDQLSAGNGKFIEVLEFIPEKHIDSSRYAGGMYFLGVDPKAPQDAYKLIYRAMFMKRVMALAKWTYRGREHLVLLKAREGTISMQTIYYDSDMRSVEEVKKPDVKDVPKEHLSLMTDLVDTMTKSEFDTSSIKDEYTAHLNMLVESKKQGITQPPITAPSIKPAVDIMAQLKDSLAKRKK